jgi:hypothetical protein
VNRCLATTLIGAADMALRPLTVSPFPGMGCRELEDPGLWTRMARIEANAIGVSSRSSSWNRQNHRPWVHHSISVDHAGLLCECRRLDSPSIRAIRVPRVLQARARQWCQRRFSGFSRPSLRSGPSCLISSRCALVPAPLTIPEFSDELLALGPGPLPGNHRVDTF